MAEALLGVVFENLSSLIQNELATMSGIKEKAEKLLSTSELIKAVLEDAEQKQLTEKPVKLWLQKLKDAVYVLDDILDECSIESHRLVGPSSFKPRNIVFRYRIGNKLKMISRRFDEIAESGDRGVAEWRQTSSIIDQPQIYGRDEDKEKIVEFLLNQACGSDFLSIYPIVGLGGVGKTTLAQMVYNDDRVSSASILVPTRDKDVATIMGTCQAHHLSGLSDDECWLLFKQCAFGPTKEEREELVAIGKEIVKKCGGLPLAAQALGGLLCTKSEEKEWLEVKERHGLAELRDLNLGGKLSIQGLDNVGSLSEAREANLRGKMDLQELCLSWRKSKSCVTNLEQVGSEILTI
ncbi:Virus X resistance protein-like, coiled-coil domain [Sesbania bispinosa]|nr:Virus X resistance protein-like, coiled-coil domain [Sesbania bispinosa]